MNTKEQSRFFGEVKLQDGENTSKVQIMKAGTYRWFSDPLHITPELLTTMKRNFDNNVKKVELAVDYFHASHQEAAGWIKGVEIRDNGETMWLEVEWTARAQEKINSKEIKYMSIDFDLNYVPNDTEEEFGATLNGAAVTNRPFIKGMNPLFSEKFSDVIAELDISDEKRDAIERILDDKPKQGKKIMDLTELKKECAVLSDSAKNEIRSIIGPAETVVKMAEDNTSLKKAVEEKDAEIKELSEKAAKHDEEIKKTKLESEFSVMLSEGNAVESQREAWLDQDIRKFTELKQDVNLDEKGNSKPVNSDAGDNAPKTAAEASDKMTQLADEKIKADKDLSSDEAMDLVMADPANKDLVKLYEEGDQA